MKRKSISGLLTVLLWFGFSAVLYAEIRTGPVRIGVITDLSGNTAFIGTSTQSGAEVAKREIAGQEPGLELIVEDCAFDTRRAISAAQKLLMIDQVDALYVDTTPMATAVAQFSTSLKKMLVYDGAADSVARANPYVFRTVVSFGLGCQRLAQSWKDRGLKEVALSLVPNESAEECLRHVRKVYPDVIDVPHNPGEDLTTQVLLMKREGIDGVFSVAYEVGVLNLLKAMTALKYYPLIGDFHGNIAGRAVREFPELAPKINTFGMEDISPEFLARLKEVRHDVPNFEAAALGYVHILQLYRAISACPMNDIDCQMTQMQTSPPDRVFGFQEWINRIADIEIVLRRWENNRFVVMVDRPST